MGGCRRPRILQRMNVEPPIPMGPVLAALAAVMTGAYLLLAALALAERAHGRWGLALLPLVLAAFAAAAYEARSLAPKH